MLVDQPIARHRVDRLKMAVNAAGRPSQTRVKVLARACGLALVECELLTGRTHQIRLHLSHLGAPILGDPLYGGATAWLDADRRASPAPTPCCTPGSCPSTTRRTAGAWTAGPRCPRPTGRSWPPWAFPVPDL